MIKLVFYCDLLKPLKMIWGIQTMGARIREPFLLLDKSGQKVLETTRRGTNVSEAY